MTLPAPPVERPEITHLTRREFLGGVMALAVLAACGGDEESSTATPTTRAIDDMFGTVNLPDRPERVIADNNTTLGNMLALGVKPVGASVNLNSLPTYLANQMEGVVDVTAPDGGVDLEKALALNPDLIIAVGGNREGGWNAESCDSYRQAATTFCYQQDYVYEEDIKQNVISVAAARGIEDAADEIIADYDARVADLSEQVRAAGFNDKSVTVIRVFQDGTYSIRVGTSESIVFRAVGIPQPEGQQDPEEFSIDLSLERLNVLNEAYAIVVYIDDNSQETPESLLDLEVWQGLTPVQEERIIFVSSGVWNSIDILGAMEIMNDVEEQLLPLA